MKINVSGKGMKVGSALTNFVKDNLDKIGDKYSKRATNADVIFSKESGNVIKAVIRVNDGTKTNHTEVVADAKAVQAYSAFSDAQMKLSKQLRRLKRKLKEHHKHKMTHDERVMLLAS